jgi:hypothetical protein
MTTEPRSYARVAATRVAADSSSTIPLRKGTDATRRWSHEETIAKVPTWPRFRYSSPDETCLDELVRGYTELTGERVTRPAKRNLIAVCYRTHGPAFLGLVAQTFGTLGTTTNLLGIIRATPPADPSVEEAPTLDPQAADQTGQPPLADEAEVVPPSMPAPQLLPSLTYGDTDRPPHGADPKRRYDRRPSNPDAATFFSAGELGRPPRRSPTAEALDR